MTFHNLIYNLKHLCCVRGVCRDSSFVWTRRLLQNDLCEIMTILWHVRGNVAWLSTCERRYISALTIQNIKNRLHN